MESVSMESVLMENVCGCRTCGWERVDGSTPEFALGMR